MLPSSIAKNSNGDILILDCASACVHVVDRSTVSKCFILGNYQEPDLSQYHSAKVASGVIYYAKDVKFSNQLSTICIDDEDQLYVNDIGRKEIVIFTKASPARAVTSSRIHILNIDCVGFCCVENTLVLL